LLLAVFAGSFAVTYALSRGAFQSLIPNSVARRNSLPVALDSGLSGNTATTSGNNRLMVPHDSNRPPVAPVAQMLMVGQGGYVSQRLLGCWHGTTAAQPTEWRLLSSLGAAEIYHRDNIDICLNWKNHQLTVTDSRWSCAGCSYSRNFSISYQVASASGDKLTLEVKTSAFPVSQRGVEDIILNQDDTIDEHIDLTDYVHWHGAVRIVTTAHLERSHS